MHGDHERHFLIEQEFQTEKGTTERETAYTTMSGKGWWNNAISGLESRLDNILAEEDKTGAVAKAAETVVKQEDAEKAPVDKKLNVEAASRNSSRSRPNSRLQDRLAKAVNKGAESAASRASSDLGSRPESPALKAATGGADTERLSMDSKRSEAVSKTEPTTNEETGSTKTEPAKVETTAKVESSPRPSTEQPAARVVADQPTSNRMSMTMSVPSIITPKDPSPRQSVDSNPPAVSEPTESGHTVEEVPRDAEELQSELSLLRTTYEESLKENREEVNSHLERIDALQTKLAYLAQQLATSAKAESTASDAEPVDKKLAEKDAQIAALMEEGQRLSKTELKHLTTIKQIRAKVQETNKEISTLKQQLAKAEKGIAEQSERAKRAEATEKSMQEKLKIVGKIEKDIAVIKAEREEAQLTIAELRRQLSDALSRAENAEKKAQSGALESEKKATASLKEDIENLRIEKKLAEDRAKRELQNAQAEAKSEREKAKITELELRGDISNLESKLELLRSRTEEATSSATGDSQAKLLRQIETLQTQYSLASENWQGIESTLTSRVTALEKDRDETAKRESDVRKKAREVNSKARKLEDELESINERARAFEQDLTEQRAAAQKLQTRLTQAESAAQDARDELEREKKIWDAEFQQRLDEEMMKWKQESQANVLGGGHLRLQPESVASQRRHSPDPLGLSTKRMQRSISGGMESPLTPMDRMFDDYSRRPSSSARHKSTSKVRTPDIGTPQRQDSVPSLSNLNGTPTLDTPSIHTFDPDDAFDNVSSPHRTINDMISVSTAAAGPSVQLVERMSAAVRRLESEKATSKEEMSRLVAQRDEAREEVVTLMREVEEKRGHDQKIEDLEKKMTDVEVRYQTTLEMLGEKTERVEELESDVLDLKKMYRELVQTMK